MARPTKLTQELVDKAGTYVEQCIGELPTKEGLSLYLDISRDTLYDWAKLDTPLGKQFSNIFERVMQEQAKRLINGGLYNKFNPTITKLMLTKHDYNDRQEVDHTTKGKELPTPILGSASVNGVHSNDSNQKAS